jgi:hypothetical protein
MSPRRILPALCLALLGLVACGGGSGKASGAGGASGTAAPGAAGAATSTTTADQAAAFKAYGDCLSQHGVKVPADFGQGGPPNRGSGSTTVPGQAAAPGQTTTTDAGGRGSGGGLGAVRNDPNFASAQQACQNLRPAARGSGGGGGGQNAAAFQAYQSCMKDNGFTLPSRGPAAAGQASSTTSSAQSPPTTIDRNSPAFQAANQKCQSLLPASQNSSQSPGDTAVLPTTTTTAP